MKIGIVGLGLIGGSFAKAISFRTKHEVYGADCNAESVKKALADGAICGILQQRTLKDMDMTILALPPKATVSFFNENAAFFGDSTVFDTCGVKQYVLNGVKAKAAEHNVCFIGVHPMAGREYSGYDYSQETLFDRASFIVVDENVPEARLLAVCALAEEIGFRHVEHTTAARHDRVIAYTSQLAHVVSNGYIQSKTLAEKDGFCAGSFADMTRVAKIDAKLWTELFLLNREPLLNEMEELMHNLEKLRDAVRDSDAAALQNILQQGNDRKVQSLEKEKQFR